MDIRGHKKKGKKDQLQRPNNSTDNARTNRTKNKKQKWEDNNAINISSDKLAKSHLEILG